MAFDLGDYVDVAARITEFRTKHPEGSLQPAELMEPFKVVEIGGQTFIAVVAAAYRSPDDMRPGVGMAYEEFPGKTPYTRGSELQNAETSAWGRAIVAALAADTRRGIASADEVRNRTADNNGSAPDPVLTPIQQAWKRQREAIERGVGKENAAIIQTRLGLDNTDEKQALLLAAAIEHFESTGELPPEPQEPGPEPPGDDAGPSGESLAMRLGELADAATGARSALLLRAYKVVLRQRWTDTDVKAVLGSSKRNIAKALEALDDADLERAVAGLEDAAKATS
jgi:hypothetical protein